MTEHEQQITRLRSHNAALERQIAQMQRRANENMAEIIRLQRERDEERNRRAIGYEEACAMWGENAAHG